MRAIFQKKGEKRASKCWTGAKTGKIFENLGKYYSEILKTDFLGLKNLSPGQFLGAPTHADTIEF